VSPGCCTGDAFATCDACGSSCGVTIGANVSASLSLAMGSVPSPGPPLEAGATHPMNMSIPVPTNDRRSIARIISFSIPSRGPASIVGNAPFVKPPNADFALRDVAVTARRSIARHDEKRHSIYERQAPSDAGARKDVRARLDLREPRAR